MLVKGTPGDAFMYCSHLRYLSWVQLMDCRLFGTKPAPDFQLKPPDQHSLKLKSNTKIFFEENMFENVCKTNATLVGTQNHHYGDIASWLSLRHKSPTTRLVLQHIAQASFSVFTWIRYTFVIWSCCAMYPFLIYFMKMESLSLHRWSFGMDE